MGPGSEFIVKVHMADIVRRDGLACVFTDLLIHCRVMSNLFLVFVSILIVWLSKAKEFLDCSIIEDEELHTIDLTSSMLASPGEPVEHSTGGCNGRNSRNPCPVQTHQHTSHAFHLCNSNSVILSSLRLRFHQETPFTTNMIS